MSLFFAFLYFINFDTFWHDAKLDSVFLEIYQCKTMEFFFGCGKILGNGLLLDYNSFKKFQVVR